MVLVEAEAEAELAAPVVQAWQRAITVAVVAAALLALLAAPAVLASSW